MLHGGARLGAYQVEHTLNALLAEGTEAPEIRPPDASCLRSDRERLDHIGAAAESAVDDHRHPAVHRRDNLRQRVNS